MEQEILRHLPTNWKVFFINGNERPVSTTVRRHLKKLHPQLTRSRRSRNSRPMLILFYFMNGYITIPKRQAKKKNRGNHVFVSTQQVPSQSDFVPIQQQPAEPDLVSAVSLPQQASTERDVVPAMSPIQQLDKQKRESVEVFLKYDPPTTNLDPDPIIQHFENLNIQRSSVFIDSSSPPITTTNLINGQNLFNKEENEDGNEDENEDEPVLISEIRQKNKEIFDEWNGKVEKIQEQIRTANEETQKQIRTANEETQKHIRKFNAETQKQIRKLNEKTQKHIHKLNLETNKQINHWNEEMQVVIQQRDKVKEDLEKILDEKNSSMEKTKVISSIEKMR